MVGALAASGISSEYMSAYAAGRTLEGFAEAEARADDLSAKLPGTDYRLQLALPPIGPGSWRLALNTMRHVRSHAPAVVLAGWLPRGFISTRPIHDLVDGFVPGRWPDHPNYWAVAADYSSGKRVAFGRHDAPPASAGDAVAASCAIPGFYHPVKVAGQRYVDGGICSTSNLDLLCGADLDLVVCLNPMSSVAPVAGGSPADRFARVMRAAAGRRLAHEARKLRSRGHRRPRPAARPRRLRPHGLQPHERLAPRPGHGAGPQVGGARAAPPARDAAATDAQLEAPAGGRPGRPRPGAA